MTITLVTICLFVLGLMMGSFAGAQVWRLRARQLIDDKRTGEEYDASEYKRLKPLVGKLSKDRSRCLACKHQLAAHDLVPLLSWLSTRGRCRYCQAPIGVMEPLIELGTGLYFAISYIVFAPTLTQVSGIAQFGIWLVIGVLFAILFAYDAKWLLLPNAINWSLVVAAVAYWAVGVLWVHQPVDLLSLGGAVLIMSGLYLLLYICSRGNWVGFGDIKLGLGLAFLLGEWKLAFLALFLANLIGCAWAIPIMVNKAKKQHHVPLGPFLISGTVITVLAGQYVLSWYLRISGLTQL